MADTNLLVLAREYKKLREEVKKVLSMPKGDKGDPGEKGEKGDKGDTGPQGFPGRDGKDGVNGFNGKDGRDGIDGKDGKDGLDGVGVSNAYIDFDNSLVIVLSDGREVNAGYLSQETKENVVATFKQGAATINELLPPQEGNANKFLKTDGTNVSWDTLDGSDIDLASPPVIGNTTPNAATFTTLTATGQTSLGGATDVESLRVYASNGTAGNNQYFGIQGGPTAVGLYSWGTANNIPMQFRTRGTGSYTFATGSSVSNTQLAVTHTASAVNYVQVTGAATGTPVIISAQGSDSSVGLSLQAKSASILFTTRSGVQRAFNIADAASTVNWLQVQGATTGNGPTLSSQGIDTNIGLNLTTKGTGALSVNTGNGEQVRVIDSGLAATSFLQLRGGAGGCAIFPGGASSETTIGSSGGFNLRFMTQGIANEQLRITNTASAVNYVQVTGAATGGRPTISVQGSDTNVGITYTTKGNSPHAFNTNTNNLQFAISHITNPVNYIDVRGSIANSPPEFRSLGADTNIDLALTPKGTGNVRFGTHTTLGSEVITGYITIKDSGGTLRKLAVIS